MTPTRITLAEAIEKAEPREDRGLFVDGDTLAPETPCAFIGENPLWDDAGEIGAKYGLRRLMREDEAAFAIRHARERKPDVSTAILCRVLGYRAAHGRDLDDLGD